jgi:hypothetical protein
LPRQSPAPVSCQVFARAHLNARLSVCSQSLS